SKLMVTPGFSSSNAEIASAQNSWVPGSSNWKLGKSSTRVSPPVSSPLQADRTRTAPLNAATAAMRFFIEPLLCVCVPVRALSVLDQRGNCLIDSLEESSHDCDECQYLLTR